MEGFNGNELVFHNEKGVVKAGGYVINSKILQSGGAAIKNLNVSNGSGIQKLAVPAGLFLIHQNKNMNEDLNMENLPEYLLILPYYYKETFVSIIRRSLEKGRSVSLVIPLPYPHIIHVQSEA